jgi:hypothetical protein
MDWKEIEPLVAGAAPTIGSLLGGFIPFPGGQMLGQLAGKMVAEALGVPPTPDAVNTAITTGDPAVIQAKLTSADIKMQAEVESFKAQLEDVQDARATTVKYVQAGSSMSMGSVIVSIVVCIGFVGISFLAMKPDLAGVDKSVTLFLLGAWSNLITAVVSFWIGSSSGSAAKSDQITALTQAAANPVKAPKK